MRLIHAQPKAAIRCRVARMGHIMASHSCLRNNGRRCAWPIVWPLSLFVCAMYWYRSISTNHSIETHSYSTVCRECMSRYSRSLMCCPHVRGAWRLDWPSVQFTFTILHIKQFGFENYAENKLPEPYHPSMSGYSEWFYFYCAYMPALFGLIFCVLSIVCVSVRMCLFVCCFYVSVGLCLK